MVTVVDVALLRKGELNFELAIRGGIVALAADAASTLEEFRKVKDCPIIKLRADHVLVRDSPVECEKALVEFRELFADSESGVMLTKHQLRRISARVTHYIQRLDYFGKYFPDLSFGVPWSQLREQFQSFGQSLDGVMSGDSNSKSSKEPLPEVSRTMQTPGRELLSAYQKMKLLHPLQKFVQFQPDFVVTDVGTAVGFLSFLIRANEIAQIADVPDIIFLQAISTKINGMVLNILSRSKQAEHPIRALHEEVIRYFVPRRALTALVQQNYLRPQGFEEPFIEYVDRVKHFARVLLLPDSEQQICDVILSGLTRDTRSALIFATRPTTFSELDSLVPSLAELNAADGTSKG